MATIERTLPALFEQAVRRFPENVYLLEKRNGQYAGSTYMQIQQSVHRCAAGLLSIGVRPGDRIALISEGRNDWVIGELGVLYAGAISVPLSVKIEERSELQFRLSHAECRMVVVSGSQAHKVFSIKDELPSLERVILFDAVQEESDFIIPFSRLLECGEQWLKEHRDAFESTWQSVRENDPANICYTSGTVADPKGIVLTHRNYTANIEQSVAMYPLPRGFITLLILPWDHSFAHTAGIYAVAWTGTSAASVQPGKTAMETLRNIPGNIREIRPTFLMSVPALAKTFRKNIEKGVAEKGRAAALLLKAGLAVGSAYHADGWRRGKGWRVMLKPLCGLFDRLLFRKIRDNFSGRIEYFIGGGALLDIDLQKFFCAIGMPMYQGYGLTEAAPVISANTPRAHKYGTSGRIVPNLDVRICDPSGKRLPGGDPGEIVVRGENVMIGYWRNPKATMETLRDGWLHTGDLGYIDSDGFLVVLGREKSLLISHDGEKYSPEGIEETIVGNSPYIDQIMLYNSQSPSTVGLIVPNREAILRWLGHRHLDPQDPFGVDAALTLLEQEVDSYRAGGKHAKLFPERWLPSAVAVLEEPFNEQNRFLNSTMKMVRGRIAEAHRQRIQALFTGEGKTVHHTANRQAMASLLRPSVKQP